MVAWAAVGAALTPLVHRAIAHLSVGLEQVTQRATLRRRLIAIVLATLFGWFAWQHGLTWRTIVYSIYTVIFVIVTSIDIDHHLILNRVLAPAALFALLVAPTMPDMTLSRALIGAAAGFAVLLLPALIMPGGMGAGDVKLAAFLGMATGFPAVLTTLATGIVLGGVATLVLLTTRRIGRRDYIPYGPFLVAGAMLVLMRW